MSKVVTIKCPCGAVHNHVTQPDTWPKDKITRRSARCNKCKKSFQYEIVGGKCTSWYS